LHPNLQELADTNACHMLRAMTDNCAGELEMLQNGYIHFMKCTVIVKLFMYTDVSLWVQLFICPAGWPVGWDCQWLLTGVMPIQVQAVYLLSAFILLTTPPPCLSCWAGG
jgi:hypothetical protein